MQYISDYSSPLGTLFLSADEIGLTGVWMEKRRYFVHCPKEEQEKKEIPVFQQTKRWLDTYFSGKEPDFSVPFHLIGTDFQKEVWNILCTIPYGETMTYGEIAKQIAGKRGISRMSAQAVGGAVGHNKISILVPCHRVVGANGSLTGYGGGIDRKVKLLALEGIDMDAFFVPEKGTAL